MAEILGLKLSGIIAWFMWRADLPDEAARASTARSAWRRTGSSTWSCPADIVQLKTERGAGIARQHFEADEVVFREGDKGDRLYVVVNGEVQIVSEKPDQAPVVIAELGPGDCFGEMALVSDHPRNATARTAGAVDVLTVDREAFHAALRSSAPAAESLPAAHCATYEGSPTEATRHDELLTTWPSSAAVRAAARSRTRWRAGKKVLLLERGGFLPREKENWDPHAVCHEARYNTKDMWHNQFGEEFNPHNHYWVGGNTKMYGAVLFRLRQQDFGAAQAPRGDLARVAAELSGFAPWYTKAEGSTRCTASAGSIPRTRPASRIRSRRSATSRASRRSWTTSRRRACTRSRCRWASASTRRTRS